MKEITVDLGCGPKNNLENYGFTGNPAAVLDNNREFLERRGSKSNTTLIVSDISCLPFKSSSIDQLFATHVLEHVDDFDSSLGEIDRVMKPNGRLTVAVPHPRYESVMRRLDEEYHGPKMHQRVISPQELVKVLESRNFEITSIDTRDFVAALYITLSYLLHRKLLKDRRMEPQSGLLIRQNDTDKQSNHSLMNRIRRKLFDFPVLKMMDKLYPFETVVQAVKK